MKNGFLFTSESVSVGHPDKICDQVSDAVLDEVLKNDPDGRVACETMVFTGLVIVGGENHDKSLSEFSGHSAGNGVRNRVYRRFHGIRL